MSDLSSPILDYEAPNDYVPTQDEKNIGMLAHILTLFGWFIAPLVIYIIKKEESDYVKEHALESLNFQISISLYIIACIPLMLLIIGIFLAIMIGFAAFILVIVATVKASEGKLYRYPFTIRLVK